MDMHSLSQQREHFEIRTQEKGRNLGTVVLSLTNWGDRWIVPDGPPVLFQHRTYGGSVSHVILCNDCGRSVESIEVSPLPGGSGNR